MKLYEIYKELVHERLTPAEAAEKFRMTEQDLKFRITRHGKRLPQILKTLDRINNDEMTRSEASALLQVGERQVNNLMKSWTVARPLKEYLVHKAVTGVKWEIRKKFAIEFIAGSCTLEEAAENAGVTDRQIRRWVSDLLNTHFGMVFKDLKELTLTKRSRLADEIEEAEGLEVAKMNVLNEVVKGHKAIEELALERVLSKRSNRKVVNVRGFTPD